MYVGAAQSVSLWGKDDGALFNISFNEMFSPLFRLFVIGNNNPQPLWIAGGLVHGRQSFCNEIWFKHVVTISIILGVVC